MRNYKELILRYLQHQKRRSLYTMTAILLAAALLSAAGILGTSIMEGELDYIKRVNGSHHAAFVNISRDAAERLSHHALVERTGIKHFLGVHHTQDGLNIVLESMDATAYEMSGMVLKEGRLPQNAQEVALEDWLLEEMGDEVSLGGVYRFILHQRGGEGVGYTGEDRMIKTLRITGVLQSGPLSQLTGYGSALAHQSLSYGMPAVPAYEALIQLKDSIDPETGIELLRNGLGFTEEQTRVNRSLLLAVKQRGEILAPYLFLAFIVVLASIASIYNIFHISVVERIRQFGLLRSIGTTPAQIMRLVLGEALILSMISIPIGLAAGMVSVKGIVALSSLFQVIPRIVIPVNMLVVSALLIFMTVLVSVLRPAAMAARISPLEAVRGQSCILPDDTFQPRSWHRILQCVFGLQGILVYRNLWRQKRRFLLTVFSMALGASLFIVFSYFVSSANPADIIKQDFMGDYVLTSRSRGSTMGYDQEMLEEISRFPGVAKVYATQEGFAQVKLQEDLITDSFKTYFSERLDYQLIPEENGVIPLTAGIYGYSDTIFDHCGYEQGEVVLVNTMKVDGMPTPITGLREGDTLRLRTSFYQDHQIVYGDPFVLTITKVANDYPVPLSARVLGPGLLISDERFTEVMGNTGYHRVDIEVEKDSDHEQLSLLLNTVSDRIHQGVLLSLRDEIDKLAREKLQISLLCYGLVLMITIIGVLSIMNTIYTNLLLRTSELGMLRAMGMSVVQMKGMLSLEGFYYGLFGGLWGLLIGNALAWGLYQLLKKEMTYLQYTVPWLAVGIVLSGCLLAGVLATVPPGRRLAGMNIVESVKVE